MKTFAEEHPQKLILIVSMTLMIMGLIFIYSSSGPFSKFLNPPRPTWHFLLKQSVWALVAVMVMFVAYRMNYELLVKFSPVLMVLSLIALIAVFPLSGANIKRWIHIGGLTVQPSEFFKIAVVAFIARIAAKRSKDKKGYKKFLAPLGMILFGIVLVVREPDLGTTALILSVVIVLLFLSGFPKRYLILLGAAGLILGSTLVIGLGYEKDRINAYRITLEDPFHPEASYQTRQSLVSLGSGGIFGKGLANGGQKHLFLPARHTDFILSAAAEEGGFIIVSLIFGLFGLLAWSGYNIAENSVDIEGAILAWGLTMMILMQGIINIGVALGLFPITGMTLPFISYGGSSLVMCAASVGIIASIARRTRSPRGYFKRVRAMNERI
ncbi:MAG: putative peptidoglycan glycosyltransferase FtsW [candidate division Zixibacteria bacterium]